MIEINKKYHTVGTVPRYDRNVVFTATYAISAYHH
jgi:hypothetical protein